MLQQKNNKLITQFFLKNTGTEQTRPSTARGYQNQNRPWIDEAYFLARPPLRPLPATGIYLNDSVDGPLITDLPADGYRRLSF
ncbi:hypothetical protein JYU34_009127 [Plutella xylostella]|uniref:Uncharacterized protein n=1 Tax=Plutella xylostella TaxID=51655 RepID=A0ABQ7QN91_PLUXY|nr:hypothetical protein JYU34_009127 [Plutella xylostella]